MIQNGPPTIEECRIAQAWVDTTLPVAILASLGKYVPRLRLDEITCKLGDEDDLHVFIGEDWETTLHEYEFAVTISTIAHRVVYPEKDSPWFPRIVEAITRRFLNAVT